MRTRVCGREAAVWASAGSVKYTRWWNRSSIHQMTRSDDAVTAKRSKRALSPGVSITLVEGQQAVNDARMWAGSGSLSISGIVQWCTVVEPSLDPPGDSLRRHRNGETVETERLRDTPRIAGFSKISDTTAERTASDTRIRYFTNCTYYLWKMATLQKLH